MSISQKINKSIGIDDTDKGKIQDVSNIEKPNDKINKSSSNNDNESKYQSHHKFDFLDMIDLSDEYGVIKTDEYEDLFNQEEITLDDKQKKILEDLKSSEGDPDLSKDKTKNKSNPEGINISPIPPSSEEPVMKRSENPNRGHNNKFEQRMQEIIQKDKSKGNNELDKLEEELFATPDEQENESLYLKPLPQFNDHSAERAAKHQDWEDVDPEKLMNAMESFEKDNDLSDDSKIPSNLQPLDSEIDFDNINNAYFSNNQSYTKKGKYFYFDHSLIVFNINYRRSEKNQGKYF